MLVIDRRLIIAFFLTALRVDVCFSVNTAGLPFKLKASIAAEYASLLLQLIIP